MWHTRVHAARSFADVARGMASDIPEIFDAFGSQLDTFMFSGIFSSVFSS